MAKKHSKKATPKRIRKPAKPKLSPVKAGELVVVSIRDCGITNQIGKADGRDNRGNIGVQFALDANLKTKDYNDFEWVNPERVRPLAIALKGKK